MRIPILYQKGDKLHKNSRLKYQHDVSPHIQISGLKERKALFLCDCGVKKEIRIGNVKSGASLSCGCLQIESISTHGMHNHALYKVWTAMLQRCNNQSNKRFKSYGGRGITVCDEWIKFENFYKDMGDRPSDSHSIDRKDNNKGYNKDNCRWATPLEQSRNRRSNVNLTFNGKTQCLAGWEDDLGIKQDTLYKRILHGWSVEKALTTAV